MGILFGNSCYMILQNKSWLWTRAHKRGSGEKCAYSGVSVNKCHFSSSLIWEASGYLFTWPSFSSRSITNTPKLCFKLKFPLKCAQKSVWKHCVHGVDVTVDVEIPSRSLLPVLGISFDGLIFLPVASIVSIPWVPCSKLYHRAGLLSLKWVLVASHLCVPHLVTVSSAALLQPWAGCRYITTCVSTTEHKSCPGSLTICPKLLYLWVLIQMHFLDLYLLPDVAE